MEISVPQREGKRTLKALKRKRQGSHSITRAIGHWVLEHRTCLALEQKPAFRPPLTHEEDEEDIPHAPGLRVSLRSAFHSKIILRDHCSKRRVMLRKCNETQENMAAAQESGEGSSQDDGSQAQGSDCQRTIYCQSVQDKQGSKQVCTHCYVMQQMKTFES